MPDLPNVLMRSATYESAMRLLKEHRIVFLVGEAATETDLPARALAANLQVSQGTTGKLFQAPRYASIDDWEDNNGVILLLNVSSYARNDLDELFGGRRRLQALIDRGACIIVSLSEPAYVALKENTRFGVWELLTAATVNLPAPESYDQHLLEKWFLSRVSRARKTHVISPGQQTFLSDPEIAAQVVDALKRPFLLESFILEFATSFNVADPNVKRHLSDFLTDVGDPARNYFDWYCELDLGTQIYLQTFAFLAGSEQKQIWAAYNDLVAKMRAYAPNLVCHPAGVLAQRLARIISDEEPNEFAPQLTDVAYETIIHHSYEYLLEAIPYFKDLSINLSVEGLDEVAGRRMRKGIAYMIARLGLPANTMGPIVLEWARCTEPTLKDCAAFASEVYLQQVPEAHADIWVWVDELQKSDEAHVRLAAIAMAFRLGQLSQPLAMESLKHLPANEDIVDNETAILYGAVRLTRLALKESTEVLKRTLEQSEHSETLASLLAQEFDEIIDEQALRGPLLTEMTRWAENKKAIVRWVSAQFVLHNTELYGITSAADVLSRAYQHEDGAQQVTVDLLQQPETRDRVVAVLREIILAGDNKLLGNIAGILMASAKTTPDVVCDALAAFAGDGEPKIRKSLPFLLSSLTEDQSSFGPASGAYKRLLGIVNEIAGDPDYEVRTSLIRNLPDIAKRDPALFYDGISSFVQDQSVEVRLAVLQALHAERNNDASQTLVRLKEFLEDGDERVRLQALQTLGSMVDDHPAAVLDIIKKLVTDESVAVKGGFLEVVRKASTHDPAAAIDVLAELVKDESVCSKATPHFIRVAVENPAKVAGQLVTHMKGTDKALKLATIAALHEFPEDHHQELADLVVETHDNGDPEIKSALITLLTEISSTVPHKASMALSSYVLDPDVGSDAVGALQQTLATSLSDSKDSLQGLAKSEQQEARLIAAQTVQGLAEDFPSEVLDVVATLFDDDEPQVLRNVMNTLRITARSRPQETLRMLTGDFVVGEGVPAPAAPAAAATAASPPAAPAAASAPPPQGTPGRSEVTDSHVQAAGPVDMASQSSTRPESQVAAAPSAEPAPESPKRSESPTRAAPAHFDTLEDARAALNNASASVRGAAIRGLEQFLPVKPLLVMELLENLVKKEPEPGNKLAALALIEEGGQYRLLESAEIIARLCDDDDIKEQAKTKFRALTRLMSPRHDNLLRTLAYSGNWTTEEISQRLTKAQTLRYAMYALRA